MLANISILAVGAALASVVSAGHVIVNNNCREDLSVWAVGEVQSLVTHVKHGESFSEELHRDRVAGGRDIKITRSPNELDGPHLQLAYNVSPNWLNYDLNYIYEPLFSGVKVTLESQGCPEITWATGTRPQGSKGQACAGLNRNLTLTLCAN